MWRDNPTWGQQIIAAELAKLGYQVSPRTVAKYRPAGLDRQRGRRRARGLGTRLLATPPRALKANAFGERVIGTIRRDCFDRMIVKNEQHAERVLRDYVAYYHGRPHRGLRMQPPDGARAQTDMYVKMFLGVVAMFPDSDRS